MTLFPGSVPSRVLALGLLVLALGLVYLGALRPVLALYRSNAERIEQLLDQRGRFERMAARRAELERALAVARRDPAFSKHYLRSTSPSLAVAELQAHLSRMVATAEGSLQSTQPLTAEAGDDLREVRLRVRLRADIEGLEELLYRLESGTPLLVLDELSVRARPVLSARRGRSAQPSLEVQLDVAGFMRAEAT
jgi:general secretion pathway protein M